MIQSGGVLQTGTGSFVAARQELYPYSELIKTENKIVTLKMEKQKSKKVGHNTPEFFFRGFKLPGTNYWLGFPEEVKPNGTYKFRRVFFTGVKNFNLNNLEEAYEFFIWKNSKFFKGSEMQKRTGEFRALLVVHDPEAEAKTNVTKRIVAHDMESVVINWDEEKVKSFATIWKINPATNSAVMIKSLLLDKLNENPQMFKGHYDNWEAQTQYLVALRKGVFAGVVSVDANKGVFFRDIPLGSNENVAINTLRSDQMIYKSLLLEIQSKSGDASSIPVSVAETNKQMESKKEPTIDVHALVNESVGKAIKQITEQFDLVPKGTTVSPPAPPVPVEEPTPVEEPAGFEAEQPVVTSQTKTEDKKKTKGKSEFEG